MECNYVSKDTDPDCGYQIVFPIPKRNAEEDKQIGDYYASCSNDDHHSRNEEMLKRYQNCYDKCSDSACIIRYKAIKGKFEALKYKLVPRLSANNYKFKFEKIHQFKVIEVLKFLK